MSAGNDLHLGRHGDRLCPRGAGLLCLDAQRACYVATVLDVLTLSGERIAAVTAFIDREVFARFGLPDELPALNG